ncbi:hypothetical protein [Methylobacterium sp. sgz302541]|uniref:hypothetical protein n=1 Tax=unclassified Methylobacterium TaxID=2615210 RepID=UPI003D329BB8
MRPLRLAGLLGLTLVAGPVSAQERAGGSFASLAAGGYSDLRVDVRPFLALGGGAQAEALRADLTAALRRSFADRIGGRGPALVVVVKSLSMRPYSGGQGGGRGFGGGGSQTDYLDGEALLVGRGGAVLARHPQLTATPASYGGAWYDPDSERRRVTAIADIYAEWLRRALPAD